jgi:integrase
MSERPAPDPAPNDPPPAGGSGRAMLTVRHLADSFVADLRVRVKLGSTEQKTLDWYRSALSKLTAAAGDFPAAELRAHHLVSVKFSNHFVRVLKALYKWACDEDVALVPRDPFRKLQMPPCGQRQRVLTRTEMVRLYLASSPRLRRLLFLLRHTIARPGEIQRLLWGDIQWERRLITLVRFKGKKRRRDGVKVRTIPLDRSAVRLLAAMYARRGRPGPDEPVWLDRFGRTQWTYNAVRCQMRRAREAAGLDPDGVEERICCYSIRHTSATEATRRGVTDNTLARVMGHAKTATTNRYQHLAGDDLVAAVDRVAARPKKAA